MSVTVPAGPYTPLKTATDVKATILGRAYTDDLDYAAVLAVVDQEGGLTPQSSGTYDPDQQGNPGYSFGPFELRSPGALPVDQGTGAAFAWSSKGIDYAVDSLVPVAAGLAGTNAIDAIVNGFEHPGNVKAEEAAAAADYKTLTGGKTVTPQVPNTGDTTAMGGIAGKIIGGLLENGQGGNPSVTTPGGGTQSGPQTSATTGDLVAGVESWLTGTAATGLAYVVLTLLGVGLVAFGLLEVLGYSPGRVARAIRPVPGSPTSSKLAAGDTIPF